MEGLADSLGEKGSYSGISSRVDWLGFAERWRGLEQRIGGRYSRPVLVVPLLIIPVALMLEMDVRLVSAMLDMLEVGLCPLEDMEPAVETETLSKFVFLGNRENEGIMQTLQGQVGRTLSFCSASQLTMGEFRGYVDGGEVIIW